MSNLTAWPNVAIWRAVRPTISCESTGAPAEMRYLIVLIGSNGGVPRMGVVR